MGFSLALCFATVSLACGGGCLIGAALTWENRRLWKKFVNGMVISGILFLFGLMWLSIRVTV